MVLVHFIWTAGGKIIIQFLGDSVLERKFVAKFAKPYNFVAQKVKLLKEQLEFFKKPYEFL